jgi:diguanylate cyclase
MEAVNLDAGRDPNNEVTEIARKVILTMARLKIPMSPENYWVWFEYTTGSNEALIKEIDGYMGCNAPFEEALNREIYARHFGRFKDNKMMERVSRETYRILKESLEKIIATENVTEGYSGRLDTFLKRLDEETEDDSGLGRMIEELIQDTRKMVRSSLELRQQLEKAQQEADDLRQKLKQVEREATRDLLTGLSNRKHLEKTLEALHKNYLKDGVPFSLIMVDIDCFKIINDTYGHMVGDAVLEFIGMVIKGAVKGRDLPARFGGEEFVILLPMTSCENACMLAENIRRDVSSKSLKIAKTNKRIGHLTVSAGVAEVCDQDTTESVLERVDRAMYLAKEAGRNTVRSERDLSKTAG